jgi:hypothetical protein
VNHAKKAIVHHRLESTIRRLSSPVVPDLEHYSRLIGGVNSALTLGDRQCERLIDENVLARACGLYDEVGVSRVRGCDQDGIHLGIGQQLIKRLRSSG